jgi:DNA-binding beta-propeller fold protein YncE
VVPPLPEDIANGGSSGLADELRKVATDLLRAAADSGHAVVDVSGTELLNSDPDTGSASYRISEALVPSGLGLSQREPADVGHLGSVVVDDVLSTVDSAVVKSLVLAIPAVPAIESEDSGESRGPVDVPEYQFSIYGVSKPLGVAVHPDGEFIYIAESGDDRGVHVFDRNGTHLGTLVPPDSKNAASRSPVYVGLGRTTGRIFVSDRTRRCIDVYDYSGAHVERLSPDELGDSWAPMAMTFDNRTSNWDDLYVTELTSGQHRVMVFDYAGDLKLEFGKKGEGIDEFSFPNGIAVDSLGNIYVADSNNFVLKIFDQDGSNPRAIDAGLPRGLAIDERNLLHVVDVFGHSVIVFQAGESLQRLFTFGGQGMGAGEFNYPNGIALDNAGRVYVTDRENDRVQVWQY